MSTFTTPARVTMTATAPLRHLCPVVDEIDEGTVTVQWSTDGATLELHALATYLGGFADTKISHEDITELIAADLAAFPGVEVSRVVTTWTTAGMSIECST